MAGSAGLSAYLIVLTMLVCGSNVVIDYCPTPQFLQLGRMGTIDCLFPEDFFNILWYNSPDSKTAPILYFRDLTKSGRGYTSGEFDVHLNGSLIINNVSLNHDQYFKAVLFQTTQDTGVSSNIRVIVTAAPSYFPTINGCNRESVCLQQVYPPFELTCKAENARPALNLTWSIRTIHGDRHIDYDMEISSHEGVFTTYSNITYTFSDTNPCCIYNLYVCKAKSSVLVLSGRESLVLIENLFQSIVPFKVVHKYAKYKSTVKLTCTDIYALYIVWKKQTSTDSFEDLNVCFINNVTCTRNESDQYVANGSSLVVQELTFGNEGVYACIYGDGVGEKMQTYHLHAYVLPDPPYPLVEGCNKHLNCVITIHNERTLSCSLRGIRPPVTLQWKVKTSSTVPQIRLINHKSDISIVDDAYQVRLTSDVIIEQTSQSRTTIECSVKEIHFQDNDVSTVFDVLYMPDVSSPFSPADDNNRYDERNASVIVFATIVPILFVLGLACLCCIVVRRRRKTTSQKNDAQKPEEIALLDLKQKEDILKSELREEYKRMCNDFQPVPYLKDKKYNIQDVFIEGGIAFRENGTWRQLKSCREICEEKNTVAVIEGNPGYGKSTVSFHLAFNWCCNESINNDILIFLRLRYLGGGISIPTAIKKFLVVDSALSEDDIESVLNVCTVTFLFDGFDKYPDLKNYDSSLIYELLERTKFTKSSIILTSRSSCLPKNLPQETKYFQLTGFTEQMQDNYFANVIYKNETAPQSHFENGRRQTTTTVLSALCEVPLFFVLFAHLSLQDDIYIATQFTTATSFFKTVIECFHQHKNNKMNTELCEGEANVHNDVQQLPKLAFNGLSEDYQRMYWEKEDVINQLTKDVYTYYLQVGILVEETFVDTGGKYITKVRFYHNTFCEWYASHYLSSYAGSNDIAEVRCVLQKFDPNYLQYVFQFASGLNKKAALIIIKYLKRNLQNGDKFSILCAQEQPEMKNELLSFIEDITRAPVTIDKHDSRLLQRSTIEILASASEKKIDIDVLWLSGLKVTYEVSHEALRLTSGLTIPKLETLKQLSITDKEEVTQSELIGILSFVDRCTKLQTLRFRNVNLPENLPVRKIPDELIKRDVLVEWRPTSECESWQKLDLGTGRWLWDDLTEDLQVFLGLSMKNMTREDIKEHVRVHCLKSVNFTNEVQKPLIDLVVFASNSDILIECVYLRDMHAEFVESSEGKYLKFLSGTLLPKLATLKQLSIMDSGRSFSKQEMNGIFNYAISCSSMKTLRFRRCNLPEKMSDLNVWKDFQKNGVKVNWRVEVPNEQSYDLNVTTGQWMYKNSDISHDEYVNLAQSLHKHDAMTNKTCV